MSSSIAPRSKRYKREASDYARSVRMARYLFGDRPSCLPRGYFARKVTTNTSRCEALVASIGFTGVTP